MTETGLVSGLLIDAFFFGLPLPPMKALFCFFRGSRPPPKGAA